MVRIEHAQADRTWQAARGRAAVAAVDWLGKNPAARLLAMPSELRDGLSPEQTEALDAAAINGGRFVTDRDLYEALDGQAVQEPEAFAGIDLAQHRLSLGDRDYQRLVGFQQAIVEGRSDAAFERHSLGRVFLDEGLRKVNFDPDGPAARTARRQLDRLLGAFEAVEGKPPMMADIRGLVADVLLPLADDQNIVRISGDDPAGVDSDTQVAQQEPVDPRRGLAPNVEPIPGNPEHEAARLLVPNKEVDGPIAGLRHYMSGSGETVEFRFDNIDTSLVKPSQFLRSKRFWTVESPVNSRCKVRCLFRRRTAMPNTSSATSHSTSRVHSYSTKMESTLLMENLVLSLTDTASTRVPIAALLPNFSLD